jgi:hypothetical protein
MQMLKAQGHTGFKAKAGGAPLGEDMERLALVPRSHRSRTRT